MGNEVFINPDGFKSEIDALSSAVEGVEGVEFKDKASLGNKSILDSMSAMIAAINLMEEAMNFYTSFTREDVQNLEKLKDNWVTKDYELAGSMKGD